MVERSRPLIDNLPVLFEDESLLVVNKPSGMLSQPGKTISDSVLTRVLDNRSDITGPSLVHRLDMDTSGLLLLAKTRASHRHLQQQFEHRKVSKRYRAVLESPVSAMGGLINLPLRLDVMNRPVQIVCRQHGKEAITLWHRQSSADDCAIVLYPVTGRTHQLRVHLAHTEGLNNPVAGDRLYGYDNEPGNRLMLHAEFLKFEHPLRHIQQRVHAPATFLESVCAKKELDT